MESIAAGLYREGRAVKRTGSTPSLCAVKAGSVGIDFLLHELLYFNFSLQSFSAMFISFIIRAELHTKVGPLTH